MGVIPRMVFTKEEQMVLSMLNSACATAARRLDSALLSALMDAISALESGKPEIAAERILMLREGK